MSIFGSLISAGTSLLASRSAKKEARRAEALNLELHRERLIREDTAIRRMVSDARQAGINPLTAIRGGAVAGSSGAQVAPALASIEFLNNAGNHFGDAVSQAIANSDPHRQKTAELEQRILTEQLNQLQKENTLLERGISRGKDYFGKVGESFSVPVSTASNHSNNRGKLLSEIQPAEIGKREVTNPHRDGTGRLVDPTLANAEQWEDRYGDIVGGIAGGIYNGIGDVVYNLEPPIRNATRKQLQKELKNQSRELTRPKVSWWENLTNNSRINGAF